MVKQRKTSASVAKTAGKLLQKNSTPKAVKKVAASAVSQRAPKKK
tara:strand:+ start:4122 stop:4256 length:135 start_codon:yes stop_codon:yes gene_type:complete